MAKHSERRYFFAHNLQYDLNNLDYPENSIQKLITSNGVIGGKYLENYFVDTLKFYQSPLKDLAKKFGYQKMEFDTAQIAHKKLTEIPIDVRVMLFEYCLKDAQIVAMVGKHLIEKMRQMGLHFTCYTAASMSLKIFQSACLKKPIPTRGNYINDIERLAYYGGRCEVFDYRKKNGIIYEDINSSYPSSMLKDIPDPTSYAKMKGNIEDVVNYLGISLCEVEASGIKYPVLPYKHNGKLLFPIGKWVGVYTHAELKKALEVGYKIKALDTIIYTRKLDIFKEFVERFYKEKNNAQSESDKLFYKIILNSLYGKFAERRYDMVFEKIEFLDPNIIEKYGDKITEKSGFAIVRGERLPDTSHTFPIISAYISAYSRLKLYEERIEKAGQIFYCDTDSIITNEDISFNRGNGIGQWKSEAYNEFQAFAPKYYFLDGKLKIKGVPKNAKSLGDMLYEYQKPIKLKEGITRKLPPNLWISIQKRIIPKADKRKRNPDGTTEPLKVVNDIKLHTMNEAVLYNALQYAPKDYIDLPLPKGL
ncbi:MAG: DNA polymerase [candidate division WOR-3 bacterium]